MRGKAIFMRGKILGKQKITPLQKLKSQMMNLKNNEKDLSQKNGKKWIFFTKSAILHNKMK